jgi:YD repeat-containing protein
VLFGGTGSEIHFLGRQEAYFSLLTRRFSMSMSKFDFSSTLAPVKRVLQTLALGALGATCFASSPALAQADLEPPPTYQSVDQFGVSLGNGTLQISSPTISVGDPAKGGLSFTATWDSKVRTWRYSNAGSIKKSWVPQDLYCSAFYTLVYMGGSNIFQRNGCSSNNFSRLDGSGELISVVGGYVYTARDGSIAQYNSSRIVSITHPSGELIAYSYNSLGLSSVSSNFGYQLHFDYTYVPMASPVLNKVTAFNNAIDACELMAESCSYSVAWPSLTFSHPGTEYHVTDALNRTTRVIYNSNDQVTGTIIGVARPGTSIAYTMQDIVPHGDGPNVMSATDGSGTWTYAYESYCPPFGNTCPQPEYYDVDTTVTAPNGAQTVYNFVYTGVMYWNGANDQLLLVTPGLGSVTNALGQKTIISETGVGLGGIVYPEGNSVDYERNEFGAITKVTTKAKSGSGLSTTTVLVTYPEDCPQYPILCHRPTSMTDARGNVTDYTYDTAGNLLTETGPAPTAGAPRPQVRHTWEQRYAWYKQNGSSAITQAATPVWVEVGSSQCMTGATCQ